MTKRRKLIDVDEPLRHRDHSRPKTRREFLHQGFITGTGTVLTGGVFSLFTNPRNVFADVSSDLEALRLDMVSNRGSNCALDFAGGAAKVPFICFDLGGGANLAGSNVMVGTNTQQDRMSDRGYSKMGLPADMVPGKASPAVTPGIGTAVLNPGTNYVNDELGLQFHQDSAMLFGILERFTSRVPGQTDGAVIPARSDNDTGNNPHNPMYGIAKAGAGGGVVTLIGSQNSESGARSMSPAALIDPEIRPTKVDRPSDVTGMVDVGDLTAVLSSPEDVTAVMESMARITHKKLKKVHTGLTQTAGVNGFPAVTKDEVVKDLMQCGYLKASHLANKFAGRDVDPASDPVIVGGTTGVGRTGIFSTDEFNNSGEYRKTASVMKMVIDGHAGAGTINMGGYDYHTGDRRTGENRDLRAGRCIGACLEYAARTGQELMVYVYSDGSVASNGNLDTAADNAGDMNNPLGGRNKGEWTGDNSSTACSFYLLYKPTAGQILTFDDTMALTSVRQIGRFDSNGSVVTSSSPAANNVNLLVNMVIANYMAINGDITPTDLSNFTNLIPNHGLGSVNSLGDLISFGKIRP